MATVTVTKPHKATVKKQPHVTVISSAGSVTLGTTDEKVDYTGLGSTWAEIPRPGDNSIARRATRNRTRAKLTAMLIDGMGSKTVDEQMKTLGLIGASAATCGVAYAEMANHRWHLVEVAPSTIDRAPLTNKIRHADVTLTFLIHVDEGLTVAISRKKKPASDKGEAKKRKTTTVRKGETLHKIAARVYGNANRADDLARINHIRKPKSIKVGQKIRY